MFVLDTQTGEETVLKTDGRISDVVAVACGGRVIVIWGDEAGIVLSERTADEWTPCVRVARTFVAGLDAAADGDQLLVTESSGGEVRAWLRRAGRWSGPVRWQGWSGVPAFDRGAPVVFRVVDSAVPLMGPAGRPMPPTAGRLVRSAVR